MGMEERTALLLGAQGMEKLAGAHVLLFGLGGVGSYTAEALARSGEMCIRDSPGRTFWPMCRPVGNIPFPAGADLAACRPHGAGPDVFVLRAGPFVVGLAAPAQVG